MKNIILCFDGTCNDPEDSLQKIRLTGNVEDDNITNVLKLHLLFGGDLSGKVAHSDQISFYYSGVGTYGNWFERLKNMVRAPEREDVGTIIKRAIRDLYSYHDPDDQIFVFGFSRGAAIARRFVSVLGNTFPALGKTPPSIRFMGVFDTVAAINKPNLIKEKRKPASDVVFETHTISPLIKEAIHLLSLDERRIAFFPTLMNQDDRVTEIWFSGAHSDVGGGFYYDGLSDIALQFLLDECVRRNLGLKILSPRAVNYSDLFPDDKDEMIQYRDVVIQPNHVGKSHQQHAMTFIKEVFLEDRTPRVNINDRRSVFPPIIHHSVFDRMADDPDYDPVPLRYHMINPYTGGAVPFKVWYGPGREEQYTGLDDEKLAAVHWPVELKKGESRRFAVYANQKFSGSRVLVKKGATYQFRIDEEELWFDGPIEATARGWKEESKKKHLAWYQKVFVKFAEDHRRHPEADWFEVVGTVNRSDAHQVRILSFLAGQDTEEKRGWTPGISGEFFAYPNDLISKYGNNLGRIDVTIVRIA